MDISRWKSRDAVCKSIDVIAYVLILVGALVWGLVGFLGFDVVSTLFGEVTVPIRILCGLVGIAALYELFWLPSIVRRWEIHLRHHPAHA
jgi:uncharacterized membrane protein YuzA (DUF378 family)